MLKPRFLIVALLVSVASFIGCGSKSLAKLPPKDQMVVAQLLSDFFAKDFTEKTFKLGSYRDVSLRYISAETFESFNDCFFKRIVDAELDSESLDKGIRFRRDYYTEKTQGFDKHVVTSITVSHRKLYGVEIYITQTELIDGKFGTSKDVFVVEGVHCSPN